MKVRGRSGMGGHGSVHALFSRQFGAAIGAQADRWDYRA